MAERDSSSQLRLRHPMQEERSNTGSLTPTSFLVRARDWILQIPVDVRQFTAGTWQDLNARRAVVGPLSSERTNCQQETIKMFVMFKVIIQYVETNLFSTSQERKKVSGMNYKDIRALMTSKEDKMNSVKKSWDENRKTYSFDISEIAAGDSRQFVQSTEEEGRWQALTFWTYTPVAILMAIIALIQLTAEFPWDQPLAESNLFLYIDRTRWFVYALWFLSILYFVLLAVTSRHAQRGYSQVERDVGSLQEDFSAISHANACFKECEGTFYTVLEIFKLHLDAVVRALNWTCKNTRLKHSTIQEELKKLWIFEADSKKSMSKLRKKLEEGEKKVPRRD